MFSKLKQAAKHWDKVSSNPQTNRIRWWQSQPILEHINRRFTGKSGLRSIPAGDVAALQQRFPGKTFNRAISVGCGDGTKEMALVRNGLVKHFDCFEISEVRVKTGQEKAEKFGISDQVNFYMEDAFAFTETHQEYDYELVYWNNSLHHMLDVDQAVGWSHNLLIDDGVFYMNDFVGPTKMQWSDTMLDVASRVRQALPDKYLADYRNASKLLPKTLARPDPEKLTAMDPTECADSERIIDSIKKYFVEPEIILTGGVVYHTALNDVLNNLDESEDRHILELLLIIDDLCTMLGETHYGVAIATK